MTNAKLTLPRSYSNNYEIPSFRNYFQQQRQTQWCWVATAVSVANFYALNNNQWLQCEVYNNTVSDYSRDYNNACEFGIRTLSDDNACNQTGNPEEAMTHAGIFVRRGIFGQQGYCWDDVINLVNNNQPPIIGLNFTGLNGNMKHVIVVFGYRSTGEWLIADPVKTKVQAYSPQQLQNLHIYASELFVSSRC